MTTKAQLLAAAKRIIADAAKKPAKRKTNPAKRIGTKKPLRASQITGTKPSKRLVKRRKANSMEGYFPNPSEVKKAHKTVYYVALLRSYPSEAGAMKEAQKVSAKTGLTLRIISD